MSKAAAPSSSEPGSLRVAITPLAVVIATNLASAHSTGQYLENLTALALVLAYDALIYRQSKRPIIDR